MLEGKQGDVQQEGKGHENRIADAFNQGFVVVLSQPFTLKKTYGQVREQGIVVGPDLGEYVMSTNHP